MFYLYVVKSRNLPYMIRNYYIQWCTLVKNFLREFHVGPLDVHVCTGEIDIPLSSNDIYLSCWIFSLIQVQGSLTDFLKIYDPD